MVLPTLNGIDIPGAESIRSEKNANILPLPIPTADSNATETFDLLGVIKTITVTGTIAEGTTATTKAKIDAFEALVNGNQSSVNFVSDSTGTVEVKIAKVEATWQLPGNNLVYSIVLIQGT